MRLPGMKKIRWVARLALWGIVASTLIGAVWGQSLAPAGTRGMAAAPTYASVHIHCQIRDPHSGARWLVVSNPASPGGPGRMIPGNDSAVAEETSSQKNLPVAVIHRGERVVVEEHTPMSDAYLEAIAVDAAAVGSPLDVRLKIGGKVVRAVAIAPGRAALVHGGEAQP